MRSSGVQSHFLNFSHFSFYMAKQSDLYILRRLLAVGFLLAAVALGCVSYFLISSSEAQTGTHRYNNIATSALDGLSISFDDRLNSVLALAKALQHGLTNSTAWPNVYVPGFYDTVLSLRDATGFDDMFLAPLVYAEELPAYENFLRDYLAMEPSIPANAGNQAYGVYGWDFNSQPIAYEEFDGQTRSYYSPNSFMVPITQILFDRDFSARNFGFNLHSIPQFGRSIDAIAECSGRHNYSVAVRVCANISTIISLPFAAAPSEINNFHSKLIQPVFLNFNSSQLVGFVGGGFDWRTLLSPLFGTSREDIDVVLANNGIELTFTTTKQGLVVKGFGDLHDRDFNGYRHEITLFSSFDGSSNAATYKISTYPTKEYYQSFSTAAPVVTAVGSSLIMLLCAGAFFLYDFYMRKASEASAIVLETKRRFVRFISHEIRTPLNAVHLGLEALTAEVKRAIDLLVACLADPNLEPPDVLEILNGWLELSFELMGNSESAVDVLNDLLNYDKIEMGTLRLEFSAVPIWDIVRTATISFLTPAKHKNVMLSLENNLDQGEDLDEDVINGFVVIGDHARLAQVMRNFISNAIKFTPETGRIRVNGERNIFISCYFVVAITSHFTLISLSLVVRIEDALSAPALLLPPESVHLLEQPRAGSIRISVTDSGVGLTVEQLAQICSEGVQFNANELQAGKGSGLGLFITKGIVEQHGGILTVSSAGLGTGTTFSIELPLYFRVPKPVMTSALKRLVPDDSVVGVDRTYSGVTPSSYSRSLSQSAVSVNGLELRKCILVVDDAASNRKMLIRILKANGYLCEEAEDGQQAIDRYVESVEKREAFCAIIMDFEMPVMNGPTATGHLRAMGCTVPILGVTGNMLPDDIQFFKAQGANQVFGKPLNLAHFEEFMLEQEEEREHSLNCTPMPTRGSIGSNDSLGDDFV